MTSKNQYRGRFAPSPSGPLHFGSLVSALASFLQARSKKGSWYVRIEDIDPPREIEGANTLILQALDNYGLHWDGEVCYQSKRLNSYQQYLRQLINSGNTFNCDCTRAMIKNSSGIYSGFCLERSLPQSPNTSIRFRSGFKFNHFNDQLLGEVKFSADTSEENFVLKRKDGLFAYQLAVVIDDWLQQISEVVRGVDLLDSTPKQLQLFHCLHAPPPDYLHHPLVSDTDGHKLSKQNKAEAIDLTNPIPTLLLALKFLGQETPQNGEQASVEELLNFATKNWDIAAIPNPILQHRNV